MRIDDLFEPAALQWGVERGLVTVQDHPALPYAIANYTHKCQYDREWNELTTQCRGLVFNRVTGEVLARPFPKFFNAGEHGEGNLAAIDPDEPAAVYDKMDGSLGILYPHPSGESQSGHAVATRGSFTSEQALHATAVWRRAYEGAVRVALPRQTWLFEIVYPANRVVLDYGPTDDLVLLAVLDTETHEDLTDRVYWPGPRAERLGHFSLRRALELPPRANAEGMVLVYPRRWGQLRVKVKQEDYVALHRIVTGLSERRVWEVARDAPPGTDPAQAVEELARGLPDEFAAFVWETHRRLSLDADAIKAEARFLHGRFMEEAKDRYRPVFAHDLDDATIENGLRKAYAEASDGAPNRALLWMLYDGRDIDAAAWRMVRPSGEAKPRELVE